MIKDNTLKQEAMSALEAKRNKLSPSAYQEETEDLQHASEQGHFDTEDMMCMDEIATFDAINVWGHDAIPTEAEDPCSRGITEWIAFASAVRFGEVAVEEG